MTVAPASGSRVSHPRTCAQHTLNASAWIIGTVRRSASGASASVASFRAANAAVTNPRIAVTTGAAVSASNTACRCTIPSRSNIVTDRRPRRSCSRGPTPAGSNHASARTTSFRTSSNDTPTARSTSTRSPSTVRSTPAATRHRSNSAVISAPACALNIPVASAACTAGYLAGIRAPTRSTLGAVASPTATSRAASPVDLPVVAAISFAGFRNPCCFARLSAPSSGRDSRAIPAATSACTASTRRCSTPIAAFTAIN
ncbi:hypothetical protein SRABI76_03402 [Microbacterium oxydans]|nr:hypothetical protein SRABI76_03402 [Microbacterium oxydans]